MEMAVQLDELRNSACKISSDGRRTADRRWCARVWLVGGSERSLPNLATRARALCRVLNANPLGVTCPRNSHQQEMIDMGHVDFAITDNIISQLSHLLGRDIAYIHTENLVKDLPPSVRIVSLRDNLQV